MFASKLVESKRWSKLPFGTVGKIQLQDVMEETHTQSVGLPLFNIPCDTFGIVLLASLGSSDLWYIGFLPPNCLGLLPE